MDITWIQLAIFTIANNFISWWLWKRYDKHLEPQLKRIEEKLKITFEEDKI